MKRSSKPAQPRPEKGRVVFYTRDSSGRHDTTPSEYIRWARQYCEREGLVCTFTPEQIDQMIRAGKPVDGDIFLDWNVSGNLMSRPALNAMFSELEKDRSISHVLMPRPDRLARPSEVEVGIALERRIRQHYGVDLVFRNRVCSRLRRGELMAVSEWLPAAMEYEAAGKFRRELAEKMLLSQLNLARQGFSTGGRAKYGLQRWLVETDGTRIRTLDDGEYVRRAGAHVLWLPREDGTFEIRCRIKRELVHMRATQLARLLTAEGIPTPDVGRTRTDNGIEHFTSGVWHATTVTNIGRDQIDAGLVEYGKRSMGDQLRFGPGGPRELDEADFSVANPEKPKVVANAPAHVVTGPARFTAKFSLSEQAQLAEILDKRAGTQRGKARSCTPARNPLGARVFDCDCGWAMYRQQYGETYRYTCGLYQQSHGQACGHNHIDGPLAVRLALSYVRQLVLAPGQLAKLKKKMAQMVADESIRNREAEHLAVVETELSNLKTQRELFGQNLALAKNRSQYDLIAAKFDNVETRIKAIESSLGKPTSSTSDTESNTAMALARLETLATTPIDDQDGIALRNLFDELNVRLFVRFGDANWGKRKVRKVRGGTFTIGAEPPPIQIYQGATARTAVKPIQTNTAASSAAVVDDSVSSGLVFPTSSHKEGNSLGNVHRGDRI